MGCRGGEVKAKVSGGRPLDLFLDASRVDVRTLGKAIMAFLKWMMMPCAGIVTLVRAIRPGKLPGRWSLGSATLDMDLGNSK